MITINRIDNYKDLHDKLGKLKLEFKIKEQILAALNSSSTTLVYTALDDHELIAICLAKYLEWDSDFFEYQIYHLELTSLSTIKLSEFQLSQFLEPILSMLHQKGAELIVARIDVQEGPYIRALESSGFLTYDHSCTFESIPCNYEKQQKHQFKDLIIRESREDDLWNLIALSSSVFKYDRFHEDDKFGKERADALHGIWIRNLFYSKESSILVAESNGAIVGYITYNMTVVSSDCNLCEQVIRIGLLAVSPLHSGKGIGHVLVDSVQEICAKKGLNLVVGTQLSNIPAVKLYQSHGFTINQSYVTLHKWNI